MSVATRSECDRHLAADGAGGRAAERLRLGRLTVHPLLERLPPIAPVPVPGGGYLPTGPAHPVLATPGGVVLAGREQVEAARQRGDEDVEAVVVELDEEQQAEAVLAGCVARHVSIDQLAVLAGYWAQAEVRRVNEERARKAGKARASKARGASSEATSASELKPPRRPRARQRASEAYKIPQSLVRKAEGLIRLDGGLADKVLAGEMSLRQALKGASLAEEPPAPAAPAPGAARAAPHGGGPEEGQAAPGEGVEKARGAAGGEEAPDEVPPPADNEAADEATPLAKEVRPRPAPHEARSRTAFLGKSQTAEEAADVLRRVYPPALLRELAMLLLAGGMAP